MKESTYFHDEGENVYKVINQAMKGISEGKGYYKSIFTTQFQQLDYDEQNMVIGVILGEFGVSTKELIDYCIEEKQVAKSTSKV